MKTQLLHLTLEIEIQEGEKLLLPDSLIGNLTKGKWLVTIQPQASISARSHDAFLNGYSQEDEELYADY